MKRRKWLLALATILTVLAVRQFAFPGRSFNAEAWRDESLIRDGVRLEMADRLVAWGTLRGKTREEVIEMMGHQPRTCYSRAGDLVYWLGRERSSFAIDSEWLVIRFDDAGRVSEYHIGTD